MNSERYGSASATIGGNVYVIGGCARYGVIINSVERFDPSSELWVCLPPMREARFRHGVATIRKRLYVCGGFGEDGVLHSAEQFDPEVGCWEMLPPMISRRAKHVAIAISGILYVFGGVNCDDNTEIALAECYDVSLDVWTPRYDMNCGREGAGAGVLLLARSNPHGDEMRDEGPLPRRRRLNYNP